MKRVWTLMMVMSVLALVSCTEDDDTKDGTFTLTFKATYDGQPAVLNETEYEYFDGRKLKLATLNLFVSSPTLVEENGESTELTDIFYVDFDLANRTLDGAREGVSFTWTLPPGRYESLDLGLGVKSDLNAMLPTDFPADHPLNEFGSQAYWTPWNSFIFSKLEGRYDNNDDGTYGMGFAYHIGSDMMYRTKTTQGNFRVRSESDNEWIVTIDYKDVFGDDMEHIDIEQYPAFHSPQDPTLTALTNMLSNNFEKAITLSQGQ